MCQSKKIIQCLYAFTGEPLLQFFFSFFFIRSQNNVIAGFTVMFRVDASIRLCQSRL